MAIERDVRHRLIEDDVQVVLKLLTFLPLPADQRRRTSVRHGIVGPAFPGNRTDQGLVVGVDNRVANGSWLELFGALRTSIATSRLACLKPIGCVHCLPVARALAGGNDLGPITLLSLVTVFQKIPNSGGLKTPETISQLAFFKSALYGDAETEPKALGRHAALDRSGSGRTSALLQAPMSPVDAVDGSSTGT